MNSFMGTVMAKAYKRSLGGLRKNLNHDNNHLAPEGIGRILLEKDLILSLYQSLQDTTANKIEASLACWQNTRKLAKGKLDHFLTVELRALTDADQQWYLPSKDQRRNSLEDYFKETEEE